MNGLGVNEWGNAAFPPFEVIEAARRGLPKKAAELLGSVLSLSDRELARILKLNERTFHRYQPDTVLDSVASERIIQLVQLAQDGEEVFDDVERFKRWWRQPAVTLGGRVPLELLDTTVGFRLVSDALLRAEFSVYA